MTDARAALHAEHAHELAEKIRYASQKLIEINDQLIDTAGRDHRAALLGTAIQLDWVADAVRAQQEENARLRAAIDRVQALCSQLPPNMPDPLQTAVAHTAGWNDAMDKVQAALAVARQVLDKEAQQ